MDKNDKIIVLHDKISEAENYINDINNAFLNNEVPEDQAGFMRSVLEDQSHILSALQLILEDILSLTE